MSTVIHAYHGSPNLFKSFNFDCMGFNGGTHGCGMGLYFTTTKVEATQYGDNIYTVLLTLLNSTSKEKLTIKEWEIESIITNLGLSNLFLEFWEKAESDVQLIEKFVAHGVDLNELMQELVKINYTHSIDETSPDDPLMPHYIVYDLDAITIIKTEDFTEM